MANDIITDIYAILRKHTKPALADTWAMVTEDRMLAEEHFNSISEQLKAVSLYWRNWSIIYGRNVDQNMKLTVIAFLEDDHTHETWMRDFSEFYIPFIQEVHRG